VGNADVMLCSKRESYYGCATPFTIFRPVLEQIAPMFCLLNSRETGYSKPRRNQGGQVKKIPVLLVSLAFAGNLFGQVPQNSAPAAARTPATVSGGAAAGGASLPPAATGASSNLVAFIALGVAGFAAASRSYSTSANH
jgi:hypothetical protein